MLTHARSLLVLTALLAIAASAPAATPPAVYDAPYAGCVNYGAQAPPFRWGWFGVEGHEDPLQWRRSYNGFPTQWQVYRRY